MIDYILNHIPALYFQCLSQYKHDFSMIFKLLPNLVFSQSFTVCEALGKRWISALSISWHILYLCFSVCLHWAVEIPIGEVVSYDSIILVIIIIQWLMITGWNRHAQKTVIFITVWTAVHKPMKSCNKYPKNVLFCPSY